MNRRGPLLTLAAVAVLAIVLLVINMSKESEPAAPATSSQPAAASSPAASAAPTTTAAPTAAPFPAKADYVGEVATATGTITLSITVEGDKAIAYACDGKTIESWLQGSATNGVLNLSGKNSRLEGRLDGPNVTGTLLIGDKSWNFSAAPVQPPAGLYVYQDNGTRDSWIVAADGTVTGVQRGADGVTAPAPGLSPDGTAVVNGRTVTATQVSGGDSNVF